MRACLNIPLSLLWLCSFPTPLLGNVKTAQKSSFQTKASTFTKIHMSLEELHSFPPTNLLSSQLSLIMSKSLRCRLERHTTPTLKNSNINPVIPQVAEPAFAKNHRFTNAKTVTNSEIMEESPPAISLSSTNFSGVRSFRLTTTSSSLIECQTF